MMRISHAKAILKAILAWKLTGKRTPLAVSWSLTERCSGQCAYCSLWQRRTPEIDTGRALAIIDELAALGTVWLSFSGGEPTLHDDLGVLLRRATSLGLETSISTNGACVARRIEEIRPAGRVKLSLDGPEEVHDLLRGEGSFGNAMRAAEACREHDVPIEFAAVLTRHNLDAIEFLVGTAARFGTSVAFQPTTLCKLWDTEENPVVPNVDAYRRAIDELMRRKRAGQREISNSLTGLRHLRAWPDPTPSPCYAGVLFCNLEPDGSVVACDRSAASREKAQPFEGSFGEAFERLETPLCMECWCASTLELNLALSFRLRPILSLAANHLM